MLTFLFQLQSIWADNRFVKDSFWLEQKTSEEVPGPLHSHFPGSPATCSPRIQLPPGQKLSTLWAWLLCPHLCSGLSHFWKKEKKRVLAPQFLGIQLRLGCLLLLVFSFHLLLQLSCFPQWPSLTFFSSLSHLLLPTTYTIFHPGHIYLA